jgi:hypothetical protein
MTTARQKYDAHREQEYQRWKEERERTAIYPKAGGTVEADLTTKGIAQRGLKIETRIPIPPWLGRGPWKMVTWWTMRSHPPEFDEPARYDVSLHFTFTRKEQTRQTESRRDRLLREREEYPSPAPAPTPSEDAP